MFVCFDFCKLQSCAPSYEPLGDCVMPHTEVRTRVQVSYGNITVLSHLKLIITKSGMEFSRM